MTDGISIGGALRLWLDKYDDPTDKGMVNSPIQFMYLYLHYRNNTYKYEGNYIPNRIKR